MRGGRGSYLAVLGGAICCYAALGAVVRIVPDYVGGSLHEPSTAIGLAIGAPALTAVFARPFGGRLADARGTRVIVAAGGLAMALASLPMFAESFAPFLAARLLVGIGEGAMMSATVLWLLRLAGPERRGRALGHIGLANYAGLTAGPLLADALGGADHAQRVFVAAVALPLVPLALARVAQAGRAPPDPAGRGGPLLRGVPRGGVAPGGGPLLLEHRLAPPLPVRG